MEHRNTKYGFYFITFRPFNVTSITKSIFPKNPIVAHFFQQIGRADELGSGMFKLMKYGKAYGGASPELIEGDVFRTIIKVPDFTVYPEELPLRPESRPESNLEMYLEKKLDSKIAAKILLALKTQELSTSQLANTLEHKTVSGELKKQISRLLLQKLIQMTLPDNPRSRLQRYRLTNTGVNFMQNLSEQQ